jgi:hypothetical protein
MADQEQAPFQIRDFPVALREEIVREAKANEMSVGEFMTGVCLAARNAGWSRATRREHDANGLSNGLPSLPDCEMLLGIIGQPNAPRWLRAAAARRLGAAIGAVPPPAPPRLRHEPNDAGEQ